MLGIYSTQRMEPWWRNPDTFDPERFNESRREDARASTPGRRSAAGSTSASACTSARWRSRRSCTSCCCATTGGSPAGYEPRSRLRHGPVPERRPPGRASPAATLDRPLGARGTFAPRAEMRSRGLRLVGALVAAGIALGLVGAARAAADSLSLSATPSQPSDAVPPQIVASGDISNAGRAVLHVDYRLADTGGCASDPTLDTGTPRRRTGTNLGVGQFWVRSPAIRRRLRSGATCCAGGSPIQTTRRSCSRSASATFTVTASDSVALVPVAGAVERPPVRRRRDRPCVRPRRDHRRDVQARGRRVRVLPWISTPALSPTTAATRPIRVWYSDPVLSQQVLDAADIWCAPG